MSQQLTCTVCSNSVEAERVVVRGDAQICDECIWKLADEIESRGSLRPGSLTGPRPLPCAFCGNPSEDASVVGELRVCELCARAVGRLVLRAPRDELEGLWGVELPEATKVRRATSEVAAELRHGARTHAELAGELVALGEEGEALIEAAIALVSAEDADRNVLQLALGVLIGVGSLDVGKLRQRVEDHEENEARRRRMREP